MTAIERLREIARPDMTQTEAAKIIGVTRERVRQLVNKHGIILSPTPREKAAALDDAAATLAESGATVTEIAAATGVHRLTAYAALRRVGIKAKRPPGPNKGVYKHEAALIRAAALGMSQSDLARELGIAQPQISLLCKKTGIRLADGRRA